jgi:SNF2 family DNA or RNA helicase
MNKSNMHVYQNHAVEHVIEHQNAGLLLEMGLGKSCVALTAIDTLMFDMCEISKVLVIAPKRVAEEVWTTESQKWDHLQHLKISKVLGTEKQRKEALRAKADIYVINCENVVWLVAQYGGAFPFDMLVIDESSKFKSPKAARFKALRQIRPRINRVVILTGTPVPNGLLDLWPQIYLLDQGERLGKTITGYRERYFTAGNRNGNIVYDYNLRKGDAVMGNDFFEKEIYDKIGDICISMKTKDWLELPERIDRNIDVKLPSKIQRMYDEFEREQILALEDLEEISAVNAAALTNKLLQFANGAVYTADKNYFEVHNEKIDELDELLDVASGKPFFVFYSYKHDLERIKKYLRKYSPRELKGSADIFDWNRGVVPFMLAHPASAGHGLNLQAGGHNLAWFSLPNWSLELYKQGVTRFDRQGQINSVINHRLIACNTMDQDMLRSIDNKDERQEILMQAVKARIEKYRPVKLIA